MKKTYNPAETMPNQRMVSLKLRRGDIFNLMLACTSLSQGPNRTHWKELYDKLSAILIEFDTKNNIFKEDTDE